MQHWLRNGGLETVLSYKPIPRHIMAGMTLSKAHAEFRAAMPDTHLGFCAVCGGQPSWATTCSCMPGSGPGDRGGAGSGGSDLDTRAVPFFELRFRQNRRARAYAGGGARGPPNRINIDTGAVFTGRLTCLVLEGDSRRFLHTGSA
jgi:serine/threonine protein phosphatase 1